MFFLKNIPLINILNQVGKYIIEYMLILYYVQEWKIYNHKQRELKRPEKHDRISGFNETLNSEFSNLYTHMKFNIYEGKGMKRFQSTVESEDIKWWTWQKAGEHIHTIP